MRKPKVLIADDDHDLVDVLTLRCQALGWEVAAAHDALTALDKIDKHVPDVVVLDVNMPTGDGLSVGETMAQHEWLAKIPIIMLTGNCDEQTVRRCHGMGAYYVTKCPDVWPRIEPLLAEFLRLDPTAARRETGQPDSAQPDSAQPTSEAARTTDPESRPRDDAAVSASCSQLVDSVFAVLRWAENCLAARDAPHPPQPEARPWVLCIDDDADFSFGLKLRLEQHGIEVLRAFAGMEGYRYAFTSPAQAILLDYQMPDGNGDYDLRRLKENPVTKDIPVILLTGHRDRALERKMYNLGAVAYLTKPVDWEILWSELQRHLQACPTLG
jgi:DNA-binding response OmpR family regulator